jgi:hypothetical protein
MKTPKFEIAELFTLAVTQLENEGHDVYSKNEVIRLLQTLATQVDEVNIDITPTNSISRDALLELKEEVTEWIEDIDGDVAQISLNYDNRIEVDLDFEPVVRGIKKCFNVFIAEHFTKDGETPNNK